VPQIDVSGLTREVAKIAEEERQKADQIALTDAYGKLSALDTQLLHDPKTGAFSRRGQNAFTAPEETRAAWQMGAAEIAHGLTTDAQRMAFHRTAVLRGADLDRAVQQHVAGEIQRYDDETMQNYIINERDAATLNFRDPARVQSAIGNQIAALTKYAQRNGLPEEWKAERIAEARSKTHIGVIDRMLSNGFDRLAKRYYEANRDGLTGADVSRVEEKLQSASTDGEAIRAVTEVWQKLGPKTPNDPLKIATMEDVIREKYKDEPNVIKAAMLELRSRAQAFNAEQSELTATNKAAVLGAFNRGATLSRLVRMPAYLELSGTEQEQIKSYVVDRVHVLTERVETERVRRGFQAYWQLSDPRRLLAMSDNSILAQEPVLGRELVGDLMRQKRVLTTSEIRVRDAAVDTDAFRHLARRAGIDPDDKTNAADLGALRYKIENAVDREQERAGRQLTRKEKDAIIQGALDTKVMLDRFILPDPERIAALVTPDERGRAYVPLSAIQKTSPMFIRDAINWLRSENLVARPELTDRQLEETFTRRIEHAYAARLTGASRKEIEDILRGMR